MADVRYKSVVGRTMVIGKLGDLIKQQRDASVCAGAIIMGSWFVQSDCQESQTLLPNYSWHTEVLGRAD